jgi:hypothetical protein
MLHPMSPNSHAAARQLPDPLRIYIAGQSQFAPKNEKTGSQLPPQQLRQRDRDIGSIAIIEEQMDVGPIHDSIQDRLKMRQAEPHSVLSRVQWSAGLADAVECQVQHIMTHR